MIISLISDTHNRHDHLSLEPSELLLHAGDFTNRGTEQEVRKFASWFGKQPSEYKMAIPGNHDFFCEKHPTQARKIFEEAGAILLIDEGFVIPETKIKVWGSPWQPWFNNWAFNFAKHNSDDEARERWGEIPEDTSILITHGPAYQILDRIKKIRQQEDPHVGCKHLRDRLQELPECSLHLSGHIHEARSQQVVETPQGSYLAVNASCWDHFNRKEKLRGPIIFELK